MKNSPSKEIATLALVSAGVIGGLMPIISKIILRELPPLTVLFLSVTFMLLVLLPIVRRDLPQVYFHRKNLLKFGFLWFTNIALFIIGLNFTTAIASGVLYAGVPLLVFALHYFVSREKIEVSQAAGVLLGFIGMVLFLIGSLQGTADFGSFTGNIIIFIATVAWATYLVYSKRLGQNVRPIILTTGSAIIAWAGSGILMVIFEGFTGLEKLRILSAGGWLSLVYIALFVRVAMIFLFNWGIKYGSPVVAGSMVYISLLTTGALTTIILGEQITSRFILGAILVIVGVFLTSTLPLLQRKPSIR
ncbi:DMT family transporter [Candidatus Gottesmanbacteria bacterium]|nr:DMT family transporter [Candidatus Gottesmanbacteria bacterium]